MVNVIGHESHGPKAGGGFGGERARRQLPVRVVAEPRRAVARYARPPRIALDRHADRCEHLIVAHDHRHVVHAVLAVQLARRLQRVRLPPRAVVDRDLGIPLREVVRPSAPPLPPRHGRRPRVPREVHAHRIVRRQWPRQSKMRDRAVGRARVIHHHRRSIHGRRLREAFVAVVGVGEILKANAILLLVARAPLGAGPKRVQILVHEHLAQCVGRVVGVRQYGFGLELGLRLVELGHDLVVDPLLPVADRVASRRRRRATKRR